MAIYTTDLITINGSSRFMGGQIYNASFQQGFNGNYSTLDVDIVAESKDYQFPPINFKTTYNIKLGSQLNLYFYAYKYCIDDGKNGKILRVSFRDGIDKLKIWWIGLKSLFQGQNIPHVIPLGNTPEDLIRLNLPRGQFDHYTYNQFQAATAFLGIPQIPSNDFETTNLQGTVMSVFSFFMQAYGYSWYMDLDGVIKLIDIKKPFLLDQALVNRFETHTKRLNSQVCTDIGNNVARGAIALQERENDFAILSGATPLWEGNFLGIPFKIKDLDACIAATLGKEVFFAYVWMKYGYVSAIESIGYQVYESFAFGSRNDNSISIAQRAKVFRILQATGQVLTSYSNNANTDPLRYTSYIVYKKVVQEDQIAFNIAKRIGEIMKKKLYTISNSFSDLDIAWEKGDPKLFSPNSTLAEAIPDFWDLLDYPRVKLIGGGLGGFTTDPFKATIGQRTGGADTWLASFNDQHPDEHAYVSVTAPDGGLGFFNFTIDRSIGNTNPVNQSTSRRDTITVVDDQFRPSFRSLGEYHPGTLIVPPVSKVDDPSNPGHLIGAAELKAREDNYARCVALFPKDLEYAASNLDEKLYGQDKYVIALIDQSAFVGVSAIYIPDFSAKKKSIKGKGTLKSSVSNSLFNIQTKRIVGVSNPVITDITSEIDFVMFEDLSNQGIDPAQYLQQAAFSRNQIDTEYTCHIRGISLGFNITPADGLNSLSISMGSDGFESSYTLKTRQPEPAAIETFRQRFPPY